LRSGSRILEIGAVKDPTFSDLTQVVINSMAGEEIPIVFDRLDCPHKKSPSNHARGKATRNP